MSDNGSSGGLWIGVAIGVGIVLAAGVIVFGLQVTPSSVPVAPGPVPPPPPRTTTVDPVQPTVPRDQPAQPQELPEAPDDRSPTPRPTPRAGTPPTMPELPPGAPPELRNQSMGRTVLTAELDRLVRDILDAEGPLALAAAAEMLNSKDPLERATAAALLAQQGALTPEYIDAVVTDKNPAVALMLLEWLGDTGRTELSDSVSQALADTGLRAQDVVDLIARGGLPFGGGRAAVDYVFETTAGQERTALLRSLAGEPNADYSTRMKAAINARDGSFEEYRTWIQQDLAANAETAADEDFQHGIKAYGMSLNGPAMLFEGPPTLGISEVASTLATGGDLKYENLALQLEFIAESEDSRVIPGTTEKLLEELSKAERKPQSPAESNAIARAKEYAKELETIEQNRPGTSRVPAPPVSAPRL